MPDPVLQKIIPLGTFCITAEILRKADIRQASFPFDWLFCSVSSITDIMRDDFKKFLDPTYLVSISDEHEGRKCMHALYDGLQFDRPTFNHKDPTLNEDRAYYERCIKRFRDSAALGPSLFLFEERGEIEKGFDELCHVIDLTYPGCRLIAIRHEFGPRNLNIVKKKGLHQLWRYFASPVIKGLSLQDPDDEVYLVKRIFPESKSIGK